MVGQCHQRSGMSLGRLRETVEDKGELAGYGSWGYEESDMTQRQKNNKINKKMKQLAIPNSNVTLIFYHDPQNNVQGSLSQLTKKLYFEAFPFKEMVITKCVRRTNLYSRNLRSDSNQTAIYLLELTIKEQIKNKSVKL